MLSLTRKGLDLACLLHLLICVCFCVCVCVAHPCAVLDGTPASSRRMRCFQALATSSLLRGPLLRFYSSVTGELPARCPKPQLIWLALLATACCDWVPSY
jgi:hypothetical protein